MNKVSPAAQEKPGGGMLPVKVLHKHPKGPGRAPAPRLKLVLRRLGPGLTQQEFEDALGDGWKLGNGKVDWLAYKEGKVSKDLSKPSRPSRAYLRVTDQSHVGALAEKVQQTSFVDARNTTKDSALIGPPCLEFAPYGRTPGGRLRHDGRQGQIDTDPEFIQFLESLTSPIAKAPAADAVADSAKEKVTSTPLIEHLREKKAAKEKQAAAKISGKHTRQESKDEKADKVVDKKAAGKPVKDTTPPSDKSKRMTKAERTAKEAAKVLNKEAAAVTQAASPSIQAKSDSASPPERKRERGKASIAAKMLQRDLGIGPGAGGRRGRRENATEPATKAQDAATTQPVTTAPTADKAAPNTRSPRKEPRASRTDRKAPNKPSMERANSDLSMGATPEDGGPIAPIIMMKKPANSPETPTAAAQQPPKGPAAARPAPAKASPTTSPTSRQAFLKHANASQGITEPLIEEALSAFGVIDKVEIDKRKGFAYVDFKEPAGLAAAIKASPVKIAQGAVQVLERKERVGGRLIPAAGTTPTSPASPGAPSAPSPTMQNHPPAAGRGFGPRGGFRGRGGRGRGMGRGGAHGHGGAPSPAHSPAPVAAGMEG